jgi:hypothetical protein
MTGVKIISQKQKSNVRWARDALESTSRITEVLSSRDTHIVVHEEAAVGSLRSADKVVVYGAPGAYDPDPEAQNRKFR